MTAAGAHSNLSPGKALSRMRFMVKRSLSGLLICAAPMSILAP